MSARDVGRELSVLLLTDQVGKLAEDHVQGRVVPFETASIHHKGSPGGGNDRDARHLQ